MANRWHLFICCSIILALAETPLVADEIKTVCPSHPLGVVVADGAGGRTYFATAFVSLVAVGAEGLAESKNDAILSAKFLLKKDGRVPHAKNGLLFGIKEEGDCSADGRIYATVSLSEQSARQAIKLKEQILQSFSKDSPAAESYSWSDKK